MTVCHTSCFEDSVTTGLVVASGNNDDDVDNITGGGAKVHKRVDVGSDRNERVKGGERELDPD